MQPEISKQFTCELNWPSGRTTDRQFMRAFEFSAWIVYHQDRFVYLSCLACTTNKSCKACVAKLADHSITWCASSRRPSLSAGRH